MYMHEVPCADYFSHINQGSDQWIELREEFVVTASEMAAAVGVDPFTSRNKLFGYKVDNRVPEFSEYQRLILDYGRREEENGFKNAARVLKHLGYGLQKTGLWVILADPRLAASPDGIIIDPVTNVMQGILEIKCPVSGALYAGLVNTNEFPQIKLAHMIQMHAQMSATGTSFGIYCVYTPTEMVLIKVPYNAKFWAEVKKRMEPFLRAVETGDRAFGKTKFKHGEKAALINFLNYILSETPSTVLSHAKLPEKQ
jgi:putative phage-type endonuclease